MSNFIFSSSLTPGSSHATMWNLKETFLAAGYTVPSSSDGTTWGPGDNLDTAAKLGNTNAWFIIRQPLAAASSADYGGVQREWAFQRGLANNYWRAAYSYSSSFTGSADAVTLPSALDQVRIIGSEFPVFAQDSTAFPTTINTARVSIAVDLESPWGWYVAALPAGGGESVFGMVFDPVVSGTFAPEDIDPYVFYRNSTSNKIFKVAGVSAGSIIYPISASIIQGPMSWMKKGFAGEKFSSMGALYYQCNGSFVGTSTNGTINPFNDLDDQLPLIWYRPTTAGQTNIFGLKGVSSIMRQALFPKRNDGDTISTISSGSRDRVIFGNLSFPWDGTTPLV